MIFKIEGRSVLTLEHKKGDKTSSYVKTDFNLEVSKELDRNQYLDKEDFPTAVGSKALTQAFVQGLVGNIHHAHQKGHWNDAEHIRYIIAELKRGFVQIADTFPSTFD